MRLIFGSCPNCGAEVPASAKVCPQCGSCEETGWSDDAITDGLDLPQEEFDYKDFVDREFGGKRVVQRGLKWVWWLTAVALLAVGLSVLALYFISTLKTGSSPEKPVRRNVLPSQKYLKFLGL